MLYDPHRKWAPRGICRWEERDLFFADGGMPNRRPSKVVQRKWDQAKEICAMCPALKECRRDTLGEAYGVFGGRDQFERYQIRRRLSQAVKFWPEERQLAWGKELHTMREAGLSWIKIQNQCGIPETPGMWLVKFWLENKPKEAKPAPKAKVVDLQLPTFGQRRPFPAKPGRRDAWVRHRGIVSDAWYRGETPDGAWIRVTVETGRGQSHRWVRAEDVKLYRPQAVTILNYSARPDDAAA